MTNKERADELRSMAHGVFRGLHEEAALLAGAEALEAQARPAPKVLAEAWGLRDGDGCDLRLWVTEAEANFAACEGHRVVRVQVVEVPAEAKPEPKVIAEGFAIIGPDGIVAIDQAVSPSHIGDVTQPLATHERNWAFDYGAPGKKLVLVKFFEVVEVPSQQKVK